MPNYLSMARHAVLTFGILVVVAVNGPAHAQTALSLTDAGTSKGFTLATFATGLPNTGGAFGDGPRGIAFRPTGEILVTDVLNSKIYLFPNHSNGQTWSPALEIANYGPTNNQTAGLAQILVGQSWKYYMTQHANSRLVEINANGAIVQEICGPSTPTCAAMSGAIGITPFPPGIPNAALNGHLFVTALLEGTIWNVDPVAKTKTLFATPGNFPDGISFSPDGLTLYVALKNANIVRGYRVSDGIQTFESAVIPGGLDGTAIGIGTLSGYIYVSFNNGEFWEIGLPPLHEGQNTLIANGGSRGDLVFADPNVYCPGGAFPSLLIPQSDRIMRLDPPGGGFFAPPTSSTSVVATSVATSVPTLSEWGQLLLVSILLITGAWFTQRRARASEVRA